MNKWGVRLIACLFFLRAISDIYNLITYTGPAGSYTTWVMEFGGWKMNTDFMGWVELIIPVYIGFQLLRFNPRGRFWALTVFWLSVIALGFYLAWLVLSPTSNFFSNTESSLVLRFLFTDWPGEINGPARIYSLYVGIFLFYSALTYFLMRKDVKQLFEKPVTTEAATNLTQGAQS